MKKKRINLSLKKITVARLSNHLRIDIRGGKTGFCTDACGIIGGTNNSNGGAICESDPQANGGAC